MLRVPGETIGRRHFLRIPVLDKARIGPTRCPDKNLPGRHRRILSAGPAISQWFAFLRCTQQHDLAYFCYDAGWSSLVARQAHNLKAAGSNPAPATNFPAVYRVHVLRNSRGQFYVGLTDNIPRRLDQHNQGISRWTRSKGPWELVWQSTDMELSAARKLENRLKRQGRGTGFYAITGLRRTGN